MRLKEGVKVSGIKPETILAMLVTERVFQKYGSELIITSICDGKHSPNSLHYSGLAFDARTRDIEQAQRLPLTEDVSDALGDEFDVVLEATHLHVEFDPDGPR